MMPHLTGFSLPCYWTTFAPTRTRHPAEEASSCTEDPSRGVRPRGEKATAAKNAVAGAAEEVATKQARRSRASAETLSARGQSLCHQRDPQ